MVLHRIIVTSVSSVLATLLTGCLALDDPLSAEGELGNGQFTYRCIDADGDPACADSEWEGSNTRLPTVAKGSRFKLEFDVTNAYLAVATYSLEPADTGALLSGNPFKAGKAGATAVMALDEQEFVGDFIHIYAEKIDNIDIEVVDSSTLFSRTTCFFEDDTLTLYDGDSCYLRASVMGDGMPLAGTLEWEFSTRFPGHPPRRQDESLAEPFEWTSSIAEDSPVISVTHKKKTVPSAVIEGEGAGEAVLVVGVEDAVRYITVRVKGDDTPPDTGNPRPDAGDDAGDAGGQDGGAS